MSFSGKMTRHRRRTQGKPCGLHWPLSFGGLRTVAPKLFKENRPHTIGASDFTSTPGGRYKKYTEGSGQEFREKLLLPALQNHEHVIVDLTEFEFVSPGFLEEIFGGLVRELGPEVVSRITIQADHQPRRLGRAQRYLQGEGGGIAGQQRTQTDLDLDTFPKRYPK